MSLVITGIKSSGSPKDLIRRKETIMPTKKKTKSTVNKAGNYTKPTMRKRLFEKIKAGTKGGKAGQWSARKAQLLAKEYKAKGGGYK
jgi:hypothetical protein